MKLLAVPFILVGMAATGLSQTPDNLLSPEVRPDRTVVFLRAPKASEVTVTGEWMRPTRPH